MYIVDRIVEQWVVCELEDKSTVELPIEKFPPNIKVGDVVYFEEGRYYIDEDATKERTNQIKELMDDLWE